jgi:uncharacterized protein YtpQ (UPF0354 family)
MRRWAAMLLGAVLGSQPALAALSPEAFTQEYATRLRASLPGSRVEILEPLQLRVTNAQGTSSTSFLDNAYTEYQADPESRDAIIDRRVAAAVESTMEPQPLVAANIVPIVKDRAWLAETAAAAMRSGAKLAPERVIDELNDTLVVVYAEDTPLNIRYFGPDDLAKAGVARDALRALAVDNLRRVLPKVELHEGEDVNMLTAGGNYEASLLLLDDIWDDGSLKVDGEIVVALPARDLLLITGSRNARGIARMRELAREIRAEGTYTLTEELFVYRQGRFVRFAP